MGFVEEILKQVRHAERAEQRKRENNLKEQRIMIKKRQIESYDTSVIKLTNSVRALNKEFEKINKNIGKSNELLSALKKFSESAEKQAKATNFSNVIMLALTLLIAGMTWQMAGKDILTGILLLFVIFYVIASFLRDK